MRLLSNGDPIGQPMIYIVDILQRQISDFETKLKSRKEAVTVNCALKTF
jgi:hypothetical protein